VIKGVKPGEPAEWLRADPAAPMRFVPTAAANVDFVPYFELDDEQMTVARASDPAILAPNAYTSPRAEPKGREGRGSVSFGCTHNQIAPE